MNEQRFLEMAQDLQDPIVQRAFGIHPDQIREGWEQQAQEWDAQQEIRDTERRAHIAYDAGM